VPNLTPAIAVLDLGSDHVFGLVEALENAGASVDVTTDRDALMNADGMIVAGDTDAAAAMARLRETRGDEIIERRLSGGRPVLGIGVGMRVMFDTVVMDGAETAVLGQWPGAVSEIDGAVIPNSIVVEAGPNSRLFDGLSGELFVVDSPLAATEWTLEVYGAFQPPVVSHANSGGRFIPAVENGPLSAGQFWPERSGDAGSQLLRNWLETLTPRKTT
jgi:glutamine amidotransferase